MSWVLCHLLRPFVFPSGGFEGIDFKCACLSVALSQGKVNGNRGRDYSGPDKNSPTPIDTASASDSIYRSR